MLPAGKAGVGEGEGRGLGEKAGEMGEGWGDWGCARPGLLSRPLAPFTSEAAGMGRRRSPGGLE